jgi:hypothetical protein
MKKKLKWALVIEKSAKQSLKGNPGGFKLGAREGSSTIGEGKGEKGTRQAQEAGPS